jgi:predicted negative regulator of RcsB-dependent stress response
VAELWWKRGWLAVASMMGFLAVVGWSVLSDSKRLDALQQENGRLQSVLRMAERKNRDLHETLASLLNSAAQKFPGEKLNASSKKPFERHEADRPCNTFVPALVSTRFES